MSCESFHRLDESKYILICQLPKDHGGKHTYCFTWSDELITKETNGDAKTNV